MLGGNATGAQNIISHGLDFARNGNTAPILYIQTSTVNNGLGDHTDSEAVLPLVGYTPGNTPGNHYVKVDATQFATATLASYSAFFVPSDHGGSLTGDDLAALNARAADIQSYINSGGGILALSEDGIRTPASVGPQPTNFGFLPFVVSAASVSQGENGFTVTPFGSSLGLTVSRCKRQLLARGFHVDRPVPDRRPGRIRPSSLNCLCRIDTRAERTDAGRCGFRGCARVDTTGCCT